MHQEKKNRNSRYRLGIHAPEFSRHKSEISKYDGYNPRRPEPNRSETYQANEDHRRTVGVD